jgi:hypothetical protein
VAVVTITYLADKALPFAPLTRIMLDREKAVTLATGGIQIALSQLAGQPIPPTPQAAPPQSKDDELLLKTLLPSYNRWQTFILKKEKDGMNAVLKICITCEEGKININQIYDFNKKNFIDENKKAGETKKAMQLVFARMAPFIGDNDLFGAFEKFLKERQYKLHDVTELLMIKEFQVFKDKIFYEPSEQKKGSIYLTDIFTVWPSHEMIEPWLLSSSLEALFDFKRASSDKENRQERLAQLLKNFKPKAVWASDWDKQLAPLYGKNFKTVPAPLVPFLSTTFNPTKFCVLSSAKVGKIEQKVLAILERATSSNNGLHEVTIKKIYWL